MGDGVLRWIWAGFCFVFMKGDGTGLMHTKYVMFCISGSLKSARGRYWAVFDVL